LAKISENEEYLCQLLKEQLELTGEMEKAIEVLVAEQNIPKRIAESLACGLQIFPKRYELNAGTFGSVGQKNLRTFCSPRSWLLAWAVLVAMLWSNWRGVVWAFWWAWMRTYSMKPTSTGNSTLTSTQSG